VGTWVRSLGDLDGDGFDELALTDNRLGSSDTIGLVPGTASGTVFLADLSDRLVADGSVSRIGGLVSGAGDITGDGWDDLVVGFDDAVGFGVMVVAGPVSGTRTTSEGTRIHLDRIRGTFNDAAGGRDVTGDGLADLLLGDVSADDNAVYVLSGPLTGARTVGPPGTFVQDAPTVDQPVRFAGDVDGDGFEDVLVGRADFDYGGAALWLGPVSGVLSLVDHDLVLAITTPDAYAGGELLGPGDLDGDGRDDMLVSATSYDDKGRVAVIRGETGFDGSVRLWRDVPDQLEGILDHEHFGAAMAALGDVDADGRADVAISSPDHRVGGLPDSRGVVYRVHGPISGVQRMNSGIAEEVIASEDGRPRAGHDLASVRSPAGVGILVGAPDHDVIAGWRYDLP